MGIRDSVKNACAVFLDRDGVINRSIVRDGKPYPPATLANWRSLPGVRSGIRAVEGGGFRASSSSPTSPMSRAATPEPGGRSMRRSNSPLPL